MSHFYFKPFAVYQRERRIAMLNKFLFVVAVVFLAVIWVSWATQYNKAINSVNYCWDSNGEHYVAPNPACNR